MTKTRWYSILAHKIWVQLELRFKSVNANFGHPQLRMLGKPYKATAPECWNSSNSIPLHITSSYCFSFSLMATMTTEEVQCFHTFSVVVSVMPIVFTGYFLVKTAIVFFSFDPDCTHAHLDWDLALGLFLFTLFLAGTLSLAWRVTALQSTCMALLLVTIALILVVSGNIIITGGTESNDSKTIEEYYRLETYPSWAQKFVSKDNGWHVFQKCIIERKICENVDKKELFPVRSASRSLLIQFVSINE